MIPGPFKFSKVSEANLLTCDPSMQRVARRAIKIVDFVVVQGHRSVAEQKLAFAQGRTKPGAIITQIDGVKVKGQHNYFPSRAYDLTPYPVDWDDVNAAIYLAGVVMACAAIEGVDLRWGGDWDEDNVFLKDQGFDDIPHFELAR